MIKSTTTRVARWSATHRWRAVGLWLLFVVSAIALMSTVPTSKMTESDSWVGESGRAAQIISDAGLAEPPAEHVLIAARSGQLDVAEAAAVADEVRRQVAILPGVASVGDLIQAPDGTAALVPITMTGSADDAADRIRPVMDATERIAAQHPDLQIGQVGDASINAGINDRVGKDLGSAESISLPITFVIMLIAFGALLAAGIPVLLAITSVIAALGMYAPLSYLMPDEGTVANVVLLIGMAVGVDYSLFYLKREREERRRGAKTLEAIEVAAATSGHAVFISGFAVIVAMSGLFLAGDVVFGSLAIGSILVVLAAVLGSLTVLPALLATLGHWVDRPRVPILWRINRRIGAGGISGRVLSPVLRRPRAMAIGATGVLLVLGAPALAMSLKPSSIQTLPDDIAQVQTFKRMEQSFPAQRPGIDVVVKADSSDWDRVAAGLARLQAAVSADDGFSPVGADAVTTSADGTVSVLSLTLAHDDGDKANAQALRRMRSQLAPAALSDIGSADVAIGGGVAADEDSSAHLTARLPWVIGFVLGLTFLMMLVMLRSVVIAVLTTVLNVLSVAAAFGVMTLVFQYTWAESLLDFHSPGYLIDWVPLFCFVVLVGLSMDYHVFVLSRVREGLQAGLPYREAVDRGIRSTASVVTSAAAVMVSVFAVFAALSMMEMKQMGVGLATAILVDATLVRLVLLPSALLLLEKRLGALRKGGAPHPSPALDSPVAVSPAPAPAAELPVLAVRHGARLAIVNNEPTPLDELIARRRDAPNVDPNVDPNAIRSDVDAIIDPGA